LRLLSAHGLVGVFFVEPLFAGRFGRLPLEEIVGLIREADQEIQLHLHTEWVDEAREPFLPGIDRKRQFLREFSLAEQTTLIAAGAALINGAGGGNVNAFRAGSFGFNLDTLGALEANKIGFDSSYNANMGGASSGLLPGQFLSEPTQYGQVKEYPVTVFRDGVGSLRHAQLGACSYRELQRLLWSALEEERKAFVILSHNFELLNQDKMRPDNLVVSRMRNLCRFFERNADSFRLRGFRGLNGVVDGTQPGLLSTSVLTTGFRMLEQLYRRRYG
jgi:hypothetical protein